MDWNEEPWLVGLKRLLCNQKHCRLEINEYDLLVEWKNENKIERIRINERFGLMFWDFQ